MNDTTPRRQGVRSPGRDTGRGGEELPDQGHQFTCRVVNVPSPSEPTPSRAREARAVAGLRRCPQCGERFAPNHPARRYCSPRCKDRAKHEAQKASGVYATKLARRRERYVPTGRPVGRPSTPKESP